MRYRIILGLAFVLAALDQLTKHLAVTHVAPHEVIRVTGFFNLVQVHNLGAAFGFLNDPSIRWQMWLFIGITALAAVIILIMARNADAGDTILFAALGCILGGALGNAVDRVRLGAVVDFLDLHYAGWHWPAFNVADMAICFGAGLTAISLLRKPPAPGGKDRRDDAAP